MTIKRMKIKFNIKKIIVHFAILNRERHENQGEKRKEEKKKRSHQSHTPQLLRQHSPLKNIAFVEMISKAKRRPFFVLK